MSESFDKLIDIVGRLRGPEGCPWDKKQTHETLKTYLLEETYEVLESIDQQNTAKLREELGDLLLQILLHAQIESEQDGFSIQDVTRDLATKLIRRHPHVFEPTREARNGLNSDQVLSQWERIKKAERETSGQSSALLESIPHALPALQQAYQMQKRVSRVGFDWTDPQQIIDKLDEELNELRVAINQTGLPSADGKASNLKTSPATEIEHEFGDVLFTLANIARFLKINPEDALRKANNRFSSRFHFMESKVTESGGEIHSLGAEEWDQRWEEAKRHEQQILTQNKPLTS